MPRPRPAPSSMAHRSVAGSTKKGKKSSASRQTHFLRCTSCGRSQRASLSGLAAPPSSFLPSVLPSLLTSFSRLVMSLLPPCCGVTDRQRLLLAASPVDTVVMSLSPGSTIGHPRPPSGRRHWFTALGRGGGGAGRRSKASPVCLSPRPLPTPLQRSLTED